MSQPFSALVLAGSRGGIDPVAHYGGASHKALIELDGRTLLVRVVDAVRAAGAQRIAVSTSDAAVADAAASLGCETLIAAAGPSASTADAFARLDAPLLVTTVDHALLDPVWIERFLADVPAHADVAALLARRDTVEAAAPATRRTWLRFADGDWSGCNLFLLATPAAARAIALWREVEADRKRPWRIVRRLGLGSLLSYLTRRLTLAEAVRRLGRSAGIEATAISTPHGRAAIDVDKPADLDLVRRLVKEPRAAITSSTAERT